MDRQTNKPKNSMIPDLRCKRLWNITCVNGISLSLASISINLHSVNFVHIFSWYLYLCTILTWRNTGKWQMPRWTAKPESTENDRKNYISSQRSVKLKVACTLIFWSSNTWNDKALLLIKENKTHHKLIPGPTNCLQTTSAISCKHSIYTQ